MTADRVSVGSPERCPHCGVRLNQDNAGELSTCCDYCATTIHGAPWPGGARVSVGSPGGAGGNEIEAAVRAFHGWPPETVVNHRDRFYVQMERAIAALDALGCSPQGEDHQAPCATCGSRCLAENCDRYVPAPVSGTEPDTAKLVEALRDALADSEARLDSPLDRAAHAYVRERESAGTAGGAAKRIVTAFLDAALAGFSVDAGRREAT